MKTAISKPQIDQIAGLNIKDGSKKSLTAQLKSVLNATQAKSLSDEIVDKFGKNFTKANVLEMVRQTTGKPIATKEGKESTKTIKLKDGVSKNEQIRMMLKDKVSITEIKNSLGLSYQRVKNVKKAMDKKEKE